MLISLAEYAARHHIDASTVRKKILAGNFPATKIGRNWCVEDSTPWVDLRCKRAEEALLGYSPD